MLTLGIDREVGLDPPAFGRFIGLLSIAFRHLGALSLKAIDIGTLTLGEGLVVDLRFTHFVYAFQQFEVFINNELAKEQGFEP